MGLLTAIYGLGWVPTALWVLLAWVVAALLVGLFFGRMIRLRDMDGPTPGSLSGQVGPPSNVVELRPVEGRGAESGDDEQL